MMQWLPEDVSTFGQEIDSLFYLIYYITAATFILVTVLMVVFLIKYRDRGDRRATYSHGNTTLEIIWTIIPGRDFDRPGVHERVDLGESETPCRRTRDFEVGVIGQAI